MPTPTTDFSIFDGQELVTYAPVSDSAVENLPAVRRPLTRSQQRNVERYITLEPTDVVFHFDGTELSSKALQVGDVVTDAGGTNYQVIFFERQTLNKSVAAVVRPI